METFQESGATLTPLEQLEKKIADALEQGTQPKLSQGEIILLQERLREAIVDPLTKLHNRRFLEEEFVRRIHAAESSSNTHELLSRMCVVFVDIDKFKHINDNFGHEAGDRYLKAIAEHLRQVSGEENIVARQGGDEFVILMTDTDPDAIRKTTEEMRRAVITASSSARSIESRRYKGKNGTSLPDDLGNVTASIGYAFFDTAIHHSADDVIRAADAAVYAAKNQGRDRVVPYVHGNIDFGEVQKAA